MWAAMMAGMMLPTAAPMVLLYARAMRKRDGSAIRRRASMRWPPATAGVGAVQRRRHRAAAAARAMVAADADDGTGASARRGGAAVVAGVYQLTPLKAGVPDRVPLADRVALARAGAKASAARSAWASAHGMYCLGCCWALMLLLFAGGVMNLAVILALTAWVAIEKLAPFGRQSARAGGAAVSAPAVWMLARARLATRPRRAASRCSSRSRRGSSWSCRTTRLDLAGLRVERALTAIAARPDEAGRQVDDRRVILAGDRVLQRVAAPLADAVDMKRALHAARRRW